MRGDGSPGQLMRPRWAITLGCYSPLTIMIIHDPTEGFGSSVSFPGTKKKHWPVIKAQDVCREPRGLRNRSVSF